jgi:flagellar hook-associated protein FlgK
MKLSLKSILESHIIDNGISKHEGILIANNLNINFNNEKFSFDDFLQGANHEIEHKKEVNSSPSKIAQIALDHLKEDPLYYKKLNKYIE